MKRKGFQAINEGPVRFGYRISVLKNWFGGPGYRELERTSQIDETESSVIFFLGRKDGSRAQDIADTVGRPKNSISRSVNTLVKKKLLRRVLDENDNRQRHLYLTEKGWKEYDCMVALFLRREEKLISSLSEPEKAFLDAVLSKLVLNLATWTRSY